MVLRRRLGVGSLVLFDTGDILFEMGEKYMDADFATMFNDVKEVRKATSLLRRWTLESGEVTDEHRTDDLRTGEDPAGV